MLFPAAAFNQIGSQFIKYVNNHQELSSNLVSSHSESAIIEAATEDLGSYVQVAKQMEAERDFTGLMDDWSKTQLARRTSSRLMEGRERRKDSRPSRSKRNQFAAFPSLDIPLVVICQLILGQLVWATMNLPGGIEKVLGFIPKSEFQCERDGYFGDIDNDCKIFHLCQRQVHPSGLIEWRHWTYACGNQTMFNQLTLTCAFVDEAVPCKHASQFQYLNEVIHKPTEPFLTDADVTSGFSYYSNRIISDGARARAFEDSQMLTQVDGNGPMGQPQVGKLKHNHESHQQHHQDQQLQQASLPDISAPVFWPADTNKIDVVDLTSRSLYIPKKDSGSTFSGLELPTSGNMDLSSSVNAKRHWRPGSLTSDAEYNTNLGGFLANQRSNSTERHSAKLDHQTDTPKQLVPSPLGFLTVGETLVGSSAGITVSIPQEASQGHRPDLVLKDVKQSQTNGEQGQRTGDETSQSFKFAIATNHWPDPAMASLLDRSASLTTAETGTTTLNPVTSASQSATSDHSATAEAAATESRSHVQQNPSGGIMRLVTAHIQRPVPANKSTDHSPQPWIGSRDSHRERVHAAIHSTRLATGIPRAAGDSAIVMRREAGRPIASVGSLTHEAQTDWPVNESWRRAFYTHLFNSKFEFLHKKKRI